MRYFNFLRHPLARIKVSKLLKNNSGSIKLNLGCGTDYKEGWINIDNNTDKNIEKLDLYWDLRHPLPFADNSVDYIFNEHFIEHLTVNEGRAFIQDAMRVLKPGGVMRMATPDLEGIAKNYFNPRWKNKKFIKKFNLEFIETSAELVNINFSWWGHKWVYDWEEMSRRVNEAGFTNTKRCKLRQSTHKELNNLEIREESDLIIEITK